MKNLLINKSAYRNNNSTNWVLLGGALAFGATALLLNSKYGHSTRLRLKRFLESFKPVARDTKVQLGNLVEDVREHVRNNADSLLGDERHQKAASEIHPAGTPSSAWKEAQEKSTFPNEKHHLN